jgi:hypothetical protein
MDFIKRFSAKLGRARPALPAGTTGEHARISNPWHAVSIIPCARACAAAQSLRGKRFLSTESPPNLPLEDCNVTDCTCHFRHHDDRRTWRKDSMTSVTRASGSPGSVPPRRRADDLVAG